MNEVDQKNVKKKSHTYKKWFKIGLRNDIIF